MSKKIRVSNTVDAANNQKGGISKDDLVVLVVKFRSTEKRDDVRLVTLAKAVQLTVGGKNVFGVQIDRPDSVKDKALCVETLVFHPDGDNYKLVTKHRRMIKKKDNQPVPNPMPRKEMRPTFLGQILGKP